jgi:hypothetical protein
VIVDGAIAQEAPRVPRTSKAAAVVIGFVMPAVSLGDQAVPVAQPILSGGACPTSGNLVAPTAIAPLDGACGATVLSPSFLLDGQKIQITDKE